MPRPGSRQARGYDATHDAIRRQYAPTVQAGRAVCARCSLPIGPREPWDLGHTEDRTSWTGPEHRACNRSAGAQKRHAQQRRTRLTW